MLKRLLHLFTGFCAVLIGICAGSNAFSAEEMPTLTILADASLSIPITKIATQYSRSANISVSTVFQSPSLHQKNIEDGEPADLLITADSELITRLTKKGLVDVKSPSNVADDRLVVAIAKSDDTLPIIGIATPDKLFPAYQTRTWVVLNPELFVEGKMVMTYLGRLADEFSGNLSMSPSMQDAVSSLMEEGRIGIVPAALARGSLKVLGELPDDKSQLHYTGVVVASENMEKARQMLAYITSDEAKAILSESGLK